MKRFFWVVIFSFLASFSFSNFSFAAKVGTAGAGGFSKQYASAKKNGCKAFAETTSGPSGKRTDREQEIACEKSIARGDKIKGTNKVISNAAEWLLTMCSSYASTGYNGVQTSTKDSRECEAEAKKVGAMAKDKTIGSDRVNNGDGSPSVRKDDIEQGGGDDSKIDDTRYKEGDDAYTPDGDSDSSSSDKKTECAVQYLGWIVCPIVRISADMTVGIYKTIVQNLLTIRAKDIFNEQVRGYWNVFRTAANVLIAIAASVVIFSQSTNLGISNYGLKKMLPRLFIFALLINVSYWVTVVAVDLSNIVGNSTFELLTQSEGWDISSDLSENVDTVLRGEDNSSGSGVGLGVGLVAGILAVTVFGGVIMMFLIVALMALILMFIILAGRQAAVIMLVVVSPIALASAILPNTEGFFNKWKSFLKSLLMIYPICSIMIGGLVLTSRILVQTSNSALWTIVYGLLPMTGLFAVYAVIKGTLSMIDKLTGGSGVIKNLGKGFESRGRKFAGNNYATKALTGVNRKVGLGTSKMLDSAANGLINSSKSRFGIRRKLGMMRYSGDRVAAEEQAYQEQKDRAELERQRDYFDHKEANGGLSRDEQRQRARVVSNLKKIDDQERDAGAAQYLAKNTGDFDKYKDDLVNAIASGNSKAVEQIMKAASNDALLGGGGRDKLTQALVDGVTAAGGASGSMQQALQYVNGDMGGKIKDRNAPLAESLKQVALGNSSLGRADILDPKDAAYATATNTEKTSTANAFADEWSKMSDLDFAKQDFEKVQNAFSKMDAVHKAQIAAKVQNIGASDELKSQMGGNDLAALNQILLQISAPQAQSAAQPTQPQVSSGQGQSPVTPATQPQAPSSQGSGQSSSPAATPAQPTPTPTTGNTSQPQNPTHTYNAVTGNSTSGSGATSKGYNPSMNDHLNVIKRQANSNNPTHTYKISTGDFTPKGDSPRNNK